MFTNLSFILRRFGRQKLTTSLHLTGLTLGITVCLLIGLFIRHELSYDGYHAKAERIYRVNQVWVDMGKKEYNYSTPFPLADAIRKDVAGVERVTKVHHPFNAVVEVAPGKKFKQDRVMMTDPEFLDVFDVERLIGDPRKALEKPYQAVLTESAAKKFFGTDNPIGKVFTYNEEFGVTVAAVIRDFPGNTHLPASVLLSFAANEKYLGTSLTQYGFVSGGSTFILLPKGAKPSRGLQASLRSIYDKSVNKEPWMLERKGSYNDLEIQPLHDVHFNAKYDGGGQWVKAVNTTWLWFFGCVGLAVLSLACINFVNLSTAQALTRAKEVGVRKTIGAGKGQLVRQFLAEAGVIVFASAVLSVVIAKLALPAINALIEKQIRFDLLRSPLLLLSLAAGVFLTALMAGLYPAWLIAKFQPATTLKSAVVPSGSSAALRKGLVVVQFTVSVCLLIGLLLIGRQMNYLRNRNLGFDKENVVTVSLPQPQEGADPLTVQRLFRNELAKIAQVKDVSFSTASFSGDNWGTMMSLTDGNDPNKKLVTLVLADDRYCGMYGLKLKAGRFVAFSDTTAVSKSLPEDQRYSKSVVNQTLVNTLGFGSAQEAIGKRFWMGMGGGHAEIVGVVEDFNVTSLHEAVGPVLITVDPAEAGRAGIKLAAGTNLPATISKINDAFENVFETGVFEFQFLDDQLNAQYKTEARLFALFKIFSLLAMFISCIGLWGLVNFSAQRRVKEIGVRKVLGASVTGIVALLTKDFLVLVAVAIAIASPLAYWGLNKWLQDFAYRVPIDWTVFGIAAATAAVIAVVTVGVHALKAAVANPVNALRSE